ncbi:MAG: excinuclease ABC subunit UvrA [Alphaproteobacteria bacterium]
MHEFISVRGAREHNLKNIDLDIPRNQLVVITGLSGSGKSSLAFDTIYAEGQRRYVESLSAYARQFLEMMQKPDVDQIDGLSPAISIEQKTTSRNPRSTVGTVTEIYDYMRLLWARAGIPYSPATGLPIESQTVSQMVDRIMLLDESSRLFVMAPFIRGRKGEYKKELEQLKKQGFQRFRINGKLYTQDALPVLDKKLKHNIDVVVDRFVVREGQESRLADSIETALKLSEGLLTICPAETVEQGSTTKNKVDAPDGEFMLSAKFACPVSGFTIEEIEPRLFSFNNPFGACPQCGGLGTDMRFDADMIVPDKSKTLRDGAIEPWANSQAPMYRQTLQSIMDHFDLNINMPFKDLPEKVQNLLLHGSNEEIDFEYDTGRSIRRLKRKFEGIIPSMERRFRETESNWSRDELSKYQTIYACASCDGYRLKPEALAIKIADKHISEICNLSILGAMEWFVDLPTKLSPKQNDIAAAILKEINERLGFLNNVGLDYLTLARNSGTLSGGESQRIRLASQIGSGLTGVLYVLDEPSIGLHQRDNERLLITLKRLRDLGNTVIVVEHDEDAILSADYLIDIGPGAGRHGGNIIAQGTPKQVLKSKDSITAQYLNGTKSIPIPKKRRTPRKGQELKLIGARANNLQNVSTTIPLGVLTCITGVSGSGKSSLIIETLWQILSKSLMGARTTPGAYDSIKGLQYLDKVIDINQSPIGRTPRSNPATYTGAFSPIRDWFAALPEAKARGYSAGRFSFNVKGGRCEACAGDGMIKIEMHFLPDVYVQCDQCKGKRYNRETLEVTYREKSISDILDMTVEEGCEFFKASPAIFDKLETLRKVGLGYIHIGQQATTLSGGEAQRIKLAKELSRKATGRTLYILDEPTTGLHFEDIRKLLEIIHTLVDNGNTVLVIEHNLEVIKTADHVIDLGPLGGNKGGQIIATGTPEQIAATKGSHTGEWLKPLLS